MSRKYTPHYADQKGSHEEKMGVGILRAVAATTPTASAAGYAIGCTWQNTAGTAGTILYVNIGTSSSATWLNIA